MSDFGNDSEQHDSVWLLLPWYVNDTLATAERHLVESHLAACPRCVEELARCKGLAAALRGRQESAPSPHPIQLARLMERVEASERGSFEALSFEDLADGGEEAAEGAEGTGAVPAQASRPAGSTAARHDRSGHPGRSASRLLGSTPRPVRWALVGQLAALLLLAAALAFGPARRFQPATTAPTAPAAAASPASPRDAGFVTLSARGANAGSSAAVRPQIRLVFIETATEKQMRDVLLSTRGRLVDGPSPIGAYTLELPAPTSAAAIPPDPAVQPPSGAAMKASATPEGTAWAGGTAEVAPTAPPAAGGTAEAAPGAPPAARAFLAEAAPDSVGTVLAYLRSQPIVRFAEPVAGTTAQPPSPTLPGAPTGKGTAPGSPEPPRP